MPAAPSRAQSVSALAHQQLTCACRYEASDFSDFLRNDTGRQPDTSALATSPYIVLTALAQLAVHQTGARRAVISLFDAEHEHAIAEATASTPLVPGQPALSCPGSLWFCGSSMPRSHWVGEHVLAAATSSEPAYFTDLPLLLADTATDPRCASRPLCRSINPSLLYAAVPIRTPRGVNIGACCVLSSTSIEDWTETATSFLRGISHAVMEHLEGNRVKHTHRRNVRVTRGLGSFLERKATLSGWQAGPNAASFLDHAGAEGSLDQTQQQFAGENLDDDDREGFLPAPSVPLTAVDTKDETTVPYRAVSWAEPRKPLSVSSTIRARVERRNTLRETATGIGGIYGRAANIMREALEVGGCFFFDVTVGSYRPQEARSPSGNDNMLDINSKSSSASSSDEQPTASPLEDANASCQVLGFSTAAASSINAAKSPQQQGNVTKQFLAKLLRRYPNGKIFSFDAVGELQSSDFSEDNSTYRAMTDETSSALTTESLDGLASTDAKRKQVAKRQRYAKEGACIQEGFIGARSVAFMPVWDASERGGLRPILYIP